MTIPITENLIRATEPDTTPPLKLEALLETIDDELEYRRTLERIRRDEASKARRAKALLDGCE